MILWLDKNVSNSYMKASQVTFHWANTDSSGSHQVAARDFQCQKFVVKIQKLLMFGELWQPLLSKVTWIGSPMQVRSWDHGVLCYHAYPRCCPANTVTDGQSKLEKRSIFGWGGTAPTSPINPYLGGNAIKKWATFLLPIHLHMLWNHQFGAKYGPRGPPRAIYEPGSQGVTEASIVSKGLISF